jgi:hypothetical protein
MSIDDLSQLWESTRVVVGIVKLSSVVGNFKLPSRELPQAKFHVILFESTTRSQINDATHVEGAIIYDQIPFSALEL